MADATIPIGKLYSEVFTNTDKVEEQAAIIDEMLSANRDCLVALFMKENPELKVSEVELVLHHTLEAVYITVRQKQETPV